MDRTHKINSLEELYKRLLPAINTKLTELKREGITNIEKLDIWNYCVNNIWKNKRDLRIYEMVDDILNIDDFKLNLYSRKKLIDKDEIE